MFLKKIIIPLASFALAMALILVLALCYGGLKESLNYNSALPISPSYKNGIVIPPNIAPLSFVSADHKLTITEVSFYSPTAGDSLTIKPWGKAFSGQQIQQWHALLQKSAGKEILVYITATDNEKSIRFKPLQWFVAVDSTDPYLIYRSSIYEDASYNHLYIEQRNIENFDTKRLLDNSLMNNNCMNCHACSGNDINNMMVHLRGSISGTLLVKNGVPHKIKVPSQYTSLRLVYPSWSNKSGLLAFSTNQVYSKHFSTPNKKGIATVDTLGDIVVLDTKTLELFSCPELTSDEFDDVFPCWATDNRSLFFCRTPVSGSRAFLAAIKHLQDKRATDLSNLSSRFYRPNADFLSVNKGETIENVNALRADLMQIDFDPKTRTFSNLRCVAQFSKMEKSVSMPFAHPSGDFIVVSLLPVTSFSVQVMGDLYKVYLKDSSTSGKVPLGVECGYRIEPIETLNTEGSETFHTFSSNGHWMAFASNRETFSIAELYLSYVDSAGNFSKAFVLPQKEPDFYSRNTRAFLFPFFSTKAATFDSKKMAEAVKAEAVEIKVIGLDKYKIKGLDASKSGH